jgi:hypothetical protein
MLEYVAELEASAKDAEVDVPANPDEEPGDAPPAPPTEAKPAVPSSTGGSCVAQAPLTLDDLYDLYYDQFKWVKVAFHVSYPVKLEEDPGSASKECKARRVDVCVSASDGGDTPRKPRHRKYWGRRFKKCVKCVFRKKGPCPDFDCKDACRGLIFKRRR